MNGSIGLLTCMLLTSALGVAATLTLAGAAHAQCVVRGSRARVTAVRVDTGVGNVVTFAVARATVTATLPSGNAAAAALELQSGLAFRAEATPDALELVLASDVDTAGGLVHAVAADGWRVEEPRVTARSSVVRARLRLPGFLTSPVDLPCSALRIASLPAPPLRSALVGPAMATSSVDTLELRASATGPVALQLETSRLAPLPFDVAARTPGVLRLRARWPGGSTLTGWAIETSLAPFSGAPARAEPGGARHTECHLGARPGDREGPVALRVGAPVFGSADATSPWAHVAARTGFTAMLRRGDRRAALIAIAGMDGQPEGWCASPRAFVDARDATFTRSAARTTSAR